MEEEEGFDFEKLIVYQKSLDLIDQVYSLTGGFPSHEKFNVTDQFRRAATSIALNIAEGSAGTKKEFASFLRISNRSVRECVVCLSIALIQKYINKDKERELRSVLIRISKMNNGLRRSISETPRTLNQKP